MTVEGLRKYYQERVVRFDQEAQDYDQRLFQNSLLRIALFIAIAGIIYFGWSWGRPLLLVFIIGVILFLQLVKRHLRLQYSRDFARQMQRRNQIEGGGLDKAFDDLEDGVHFHEAEHAYCQDVDLFGKGSFFQYLNRTSLITGRKKLADLLKSNRIDRIEERQLAVQEIGKKSEWRQEFWAEASLVEVEHSPQEIMDWLSSYQSFIAPYWRMIIYSFSVLSILVLLAFGLEWIAEGIVVIWFIVGLAISGIFVKRINELSHYASKSLATFRQYAKLLKRIEEESWTSSYICQEVERLKHQQVVASQTIAMFSKYLNALDQRSNIFVAVFTNGLFLRDIYCAWRVERWIASFGNNVSDWFEVIAFFDVQSSLGNFYYNHPDYQFASIVREGTSVLEAKQLGHPLLKRNKRVDNDFSIDQESFYIITGANMAGKSTFLRTISLSIIMSNVGLPICAHQAEYYPIKLVTSMRTSDSLADDASYFFSELKRLRYIIDRMAEDQYFIILDEILKGTNSVDKAAGSKKFVERLVRSHSTGIIATHDLSLCETADDFEEVQNYYFDAQIIDDELFFDYRLKPGICQNMNASFLLRKMDII